MYVIIMIINVHACMYRALSGIQYLLLFSAIHAACSLPSAGKIPAKERHRRQNYNNQHDQHLHRVCDHPRNGFNEVTSSHSNFHEDRTWRWDCTQVVQNSPQQQCRWSRDVNNFDEPFF